MINTSNSNNDNNTNHSRNNTTNHNSHEHDNHNNNNNNNHNNDNDANDTSAKRPRAGGGAHLRRHDEARKVEVSAAQVNTKQIIRLRSYSSEK